MWLNCDNGEDGNHDHDNNDHDQYTLTYTEREREIAQTPKLIITKLFNIKFELIIITCRRPSTVYVIKANWEY